MRVAEDNCLIVKNKLSPKACRVHEKGEARQYEWQHRFSSQKVDWTRLRTAGTGFHECISLARAERGYPQGQSSFWAAPESLFLMGSRANGITVIELLVVI